MVSGVAAKGDKRTITLLSTTDLHTNLVAYDYYASKSAEWGLAKVATLIKQEREKAPDALLLDSGDTVSYTHLCWELWQTKVWPNITK